VSASLESRTAPGDVSILAMPDRVVHDQVGHLPGVEGRPDSTAADRVLVAIETGSRSARIDDRIRQPTCWIGCIHGCQCR